MHGDSFLINGRLTYSGLHAFTVGFQGSGPCFTTPNHTIDNNPFGKSGTELDPAYAGRMDRLIRAADEVRMDNNMTKQEPPADWGIAISEVLVQWARKT